MNFDLSKIKNVHFVGIGGIGISAIARMMLGEGKNVTGQDIEKSEITLELEKLGAGIKIGQSLENVPKNAELIIYTIAIEYYDPELFKKIKSGRIQSCSYPEMLGIISKDKFTIAVSGTHGKTTTTGMIAKVLASAGKNPMVIIGSLLQDRTNFIRGQSDLFVVEACEYRRSFLNLNPKVLVITNIDADHLDYYKDLEDIKSAFRELVFKVPEDGYIICNPRDPEIKDVITGTKASVVDYSKYLNINLKLKIPGIHNKKNAATSFAVGNILGISDQNINEALESFPGTWRRFELKGETKLGAKIYDDYAHHPTEISSTLEAFRELYPKEEGWRITVVFQPHLFSRTKLLLKDFAKSFTLADKVLILPIYYAREEDDGTISSLILSLQINKFENRGIARAFHDFESAFEVISKDYPTERDVIVTMGAGQAFKIGERLLE